MTAKLEPEDVAGEVALICELVALGKTLRQIQAQMGVSMGTILNWVAMPGHSEQYARAREAASDLFETDIIETALASTAYSATSDRVKIDALKWVAARRSPKKYGEKVQQEITGADGGNLILEVAGIASPKG